MSNLSAFGEVSASDLYVSGTTQLHELGELRVDRQGRKFRYCRAGAVALAAGQLQQAPAQITTNQNLVVVTGAINSKEIVATLAAAVVENQYAGGWVAITVTPGVGYAYKIKGHAAQSVATGDVTLALDDIVQVALTTTSRVDLVPNPWNAVIVSIGGTNTGKIAGVANDVIAIDAYGWLQTGGACTVLNDAGTIVVGNELSASNGTVGAVETEVAGQPNIGHALTGIAANEYGLVWLTLD